MTTPGRDKEVRPQSGPVVVPWLYEKIGVFLSIVLGVVLSTYGFCYAGYSLGILFPFRSGGANSFQDAVGYFLKGVELLLLAPLLYLIVASMYTHLNAVRVRLGELNGASAESSPAAAKRLDETFELLHRVKQSIAGLFVALLLTDLIGRVFKQQEMSWSAIVAEVTALTMGLLYYAVQKSSAIDSHHHRSDS